MPLHHLSSLLLLYLLLANEKSCLAESRVTQIYTSARKNVTLSCDDDGTHINVTSWMLPNGHTLNTDDTDTIFRIKIQRDSNLLQLMLQLSDVTTDDEGLYSCIVVKNQNGSTFVELHHFQLHVIALPSKPYQCHVLQIDSAKEFLCSSDSTRSDDVIYHLMHKRDHLDDVLVTESPNPEFSLNHVTANGVSNWAANGDRKILLFMCAVKRTFPDARSCGQTIAVELGVAGEEREDRDTSNVQVVVPVVAVLAVSLLITLIVGTICIYRHKLREADHPKQESAMADPHSIMAPPQLNDLMRSRSSLKGQGLIRDTSQRVRQVRADSPTTDLRNSPLRLSTSLESSPTIARGNSDEAHTSMADNGNRKQPSAECYGTQQFSPRNGKAKYPIPVSRKSPSAPRCESAWNTSGIPFSQAGPSRYSEYGKEDGEREDTHFKKRWPDKQRKYYYYDNLEAPDPFVNEEKLAFAKNSKSDTHSRGSSFYKLFKPSNVRVTEKKSSVGDIDGGNQFRQRYGSLELKDEIRLTGGGSTLKEYPPYVNIDGQAMRDEQGHASLRHEISREEASHLKVHEGGSSSDDFSYHRLPARSSRETEPPGGSSSSPVTPKITNATCTINADKSKPLPSAREREQGNAGKDCGSNFNMPKKRERNGDYDYVKYPIRAERLFKSDNQKVDGGMYAHKSDDIGRVVKSSKNYDRIPMRYTQTPPHFPNFHVCERHFRRNINAATIDKHDKNRMFSGEPNLKKSSALSKSLTSLDFIVPGSSSYYDNYSSAGRSDFRDSEPYTFTERRLTVVPPDLDLPPKLPKKTRVSSPYLMTSYMKRRLPSDDYVYHVPSNVPVSREPPEKEKVTETEKGIPNEAHEQKGQFGTKYNNLTSDAVLLPLRTSSIASNSSSSIRSDELNDKQLLPFSKADNNSILTSNLKVLSTGKPSAEYPHERVKNSNTIQHNIPSKNADAERYFNEPRTLRTSSPLAIAESSSSWSKKQKYHNKLTTNTSHNDDVFEDGRSDQMKKNSTNNEISSSRDIAKVQQDNGNALSSDRQKTNLKDASTYNTSYEEDTYYRSGRPLYVYIPGRHKKRRSKSRSVTGSVSSDQSSASSNLGSSRRSVEKLVVSPADVTSDKERSPVVDVDKNSTVRDTPWQNVLKQDGDRGHGKTRQSSRDSVARKITTSTSDERWSSQSRPMARSRQQSQSAEIMESESRGKVQSLEQSVSKMRRSRSLSSLHLGNEEVLRSGLFPRYWRYGELLRPRVRQTDYDGVFRKF